MRQGYFGRSRYERRRNSRNVEMKAEKIMATLSQQHDELPTAALKAAVQQRAEIAPLMLAELKALVERFDAILDGAKSEAEFNSLMRKATEVPSPLFYGFLLAAEWKQTEAYPLYARLLGWPHAGSRALLSEMVYDERSSRVMAKFYDGDPEPLFTLILDKNGDESIRFWQWRTLIVLGARGQIDLDVPRAFLIRAFDELEQEPDQLVWQGWEMVIIYFGLTDLVPRVARARAAERIRDRTLANFHADWAVARAHPENPLPNDPVFAFGSFLVEAEAAVETRA
jgi:hypothetical protein